VIVGRVRVRNTVTVGDFHVSSFRNFEMITSGELARGVDDGFQRFDKFARFPLVFEPIAHLLPVGVVPDQVRRSQLGEMTADGLY
jgi:hypothetical protein